MNRSSEPGSGFQFPIMPGFLQITIPEGSAIVSEDGNVQALLQNMN